VERDYWSRFPSPTVDQISRDFGYILETSVRGYDKAALGNPFPRCIAITPSYVVGNYWAALGSIICHCLPARWVKPVQLPQPLLADLCLTSPTILQSA